MSKQNKTTNSGRRAFLGGASMSIAGAAALGFGFAPAAQAMSTKTLIYVFLRGGTDGLNLIPPRTGTNYTLYEAARPTLALTPSQSLNLAGVQSFGIHPSASALRQVFANNQLAIIQACGHPAGTETRSHFDAQEQIELGTPGNQTSSNGWLARYLETTMEAPGAIFTALASSSNPPTSLVGWPDVATLDSTGGFHPNVANRRFRNTHLEALRALYQSGTGSLDVAALAAVDAVDLINSLELDEY